MSNPEPTSPAQQQSALQLAVLELLRVDALGSRSSTKFHEAMVGLQAAYAALGAPPLPTGEPEDDFELLLNDAGIAADEPATVWPKSNDVGRYGDMSPLAHLRVGLDGDNDAYVSVYDGEGGAVVEFNMPFSGGGKSPRTREALVALMVAMEMDNAEDPSRNWWLRGQTAKSPQP
ncbi:hypothetical protein ACEP6V_21160 [Pseudomonas aeruginosa]|uniref:hypothetical protein n=1 Tax=Pseudomonas aeruginosa TaxID=287 RepID=UPI00358E1C23